MFCPSCGAEYTIELKYCNRCGANLSSLTTAEPILAPVDVTKSVAIIGTTMAVLTLGGFIALISGAIALAGKTSIGTDPIMAVVVLGMITVLVSDIFLARLLSKLINASLSSGKPAKFKPPQALAAAAPPQLRSFPPSQLQEVPSVTENTTRLFEPEYRAPSGSDDPALAKKADR